MFPWPLVAVLTAVVVLAMRRALASQGFSALSRIAGMVLVGAGSTPGRR